MESCDDPIVAEVRTAREEYAAAMHNDLAAICADLRRRQALHAERIATFAPRPLPEVQKTA